MKDWSPWLTNNYIILKKSEKWEAKSLEEEKIASLLAELKKLMGKVKLSKEEEQKQAYKQCKCWNWRWEIRKKEEQKGQKGVQKGEGGKGMEEGIAKD